MSQVLTEGSPTKPAFLIIRPRYTSPRSLAILGKERQLSPRTLIQLTRAWFVHMKRSIATAPESYGRHLLNLRSLIEVLGIVVTSSQSVEGAWKPSRRHACSTGGGNDRRCHVCRARGVRRNQSSDTGSGSTPAGQRAAVEPRAWRVEVAASLLPWCYRSAPISCATFVSDSWSRPPAGSSSVVNKFFPSSNPFCLYQSNFHSHERR